MSATPRFFREFWADVQETNFGNTAPVLRDDGQWWLGYVQDNREHYFLVDFDASTQPAEWIHCRHLWPHHIRFVGHRYPWGQSERYPHSTVQVALRERRGGPMVFRPATVVVQWRDLLLGIRLDDHQPTECRFVHRGQTVECLPGPGDGQNFFQRTDGLTYTKHIINFPPAADQLRSLDRLPEFVQETCRITLGGGDFLHRYNEIVPRSTSFYSIEPRADPVPDFGNAYARPDRELHVGVRVFARAGPDTVMFVCFEVHNDAVGRRMSWDEDALRESCNIYLRLHSVITIDAFPWRWITILPVTICTSWRDYH